MTIKVKRYSRFKSNNRSLTNRTIKNQKTDDNRWKVANDMTGDDCRKYFSVIKKMFGEYVTATRSDNMITKMI